MPYLPTELLCDQNGEDKRPCEQTDLLRRKGQLLDDSGVMRLRDQKQKMDLVLGSLRKFCHENITAFYSVLVQQKMFIYFGRTSDRRIRARGTAQNLGRGENPSVEHGRFSHQALEHQSNADGSPDVVRSNLFPKIALYQVVYEYCVAGSCNGAVSG